MKLTHGSDYGLFGDIKGKASGNFEQGFEHCDWPDPFAGFFVERFDEATGPNFNSFIRDRPTCPGFCPEPDGFSPVWCFQEGKEVGVPAPCIAWVGGFLERAEAFVDLRGGDALGELGGGDFCGLLAEGEEFISLCCFGGLRVELLGHFLKGVFVEGRARIWSQGSKGYCPSSRQGPGCCPRAFCFPEGFFCLLGWRDKKLCLEQVVAEF